jgi:hypothetical protein
MTRVDLDYIESFEFVSDEELAILIQESQLVPELQLQDAVIISEDDLEWQAELEFGGPLFDYTDEQWDAELDRAFSEAFTPSKKIERGVAYCENVKCNDYLKGVFLFMHEGDWKCAKCKEPSDHLIAEQGIPEREGQVPFSAVRVEYCYEPASKRYTEIVQLSDEEYTGPSGTYTLQSPLVKTPLRASKMAESLLTILNEGVILDDDLSSAPKSQERILSFDKPADEFRKDLKALENRLRDNSFLQQPSVVSTSIEVELNLEEGGSSGPESNDASRTTNPEPRVLPSGDSGAGTLHVHASDQPGGARPERAEGGLHPVHHLGSRSEDLRRKPSEGRRGRNYRTSASKLCTAAGRYLSSVVRGKGGRSSSGS